MWCGVVWCSLAVEALAVVVSFHFPYLLTEYLFVVADDGNEKNFGFL